MPAARLRRLVPQAHSALIVPVPAAEAVVGPWRESHDPAAGAGMPAHVTLLYPFAPTAALDRLEGELEALFGGFAPFDFRLERVGRFPGVLYLAPEPAEPFVRLTKALVERWPEYPPYEGAHDEIVPHLTVAAGAEPEGAVSALSGQLPLPARADEVWLMTKPWRRGWNVRRALPLGERQRHVAVPESVNVFPGSGTKRHE